MVKEMDCGIVVSDFKLQSRYYVHFRTNTFGKSMNPSYPPSYCTTTVLLEEIALELCNLQSLICQETNQLGYPFLMTVIVSLRTLPTLE